MKSWVCSKVKQTICCLFLSVHLRYRAARSVAGIVREDTVIDCGLESLRENLMDVDDRALLYSWSLESDP
jgi:hypothetical protein